jgi:hypothetical protein
MEPTCGTCLAVRERGERGWATAGLFGWSGPRGQPRLGWPLPFFLSVSFFFLFLISILVFEKATLL